MKLKGHTDNVKALLLNRDGTQVLFHLHIYLMTVQHFMQQNPPPPLCMLLHRLN